MRRRRDQTLPRARTVVVVRGIPSMGTLRTAVITNSRAEAKALRMELSFLRNRLVTIPSTVLLTIRISTSGLAMEVRGEAVKAFARSPLFRIFRIH